MRSTTNLTWLLGLAVAGCFEAPAAVETSALTAPLPTARLTTNDLFLPFKPGVFGYARDRGTTSGTQQFADFGITHLSEPIALDTSPIDNPDLKRRVQITLNDVSAPIASPSGDVTVHGKIYTRSTDPTKPGYTTADVQETVSFVTNQTKTTTTYFDAVTSISTPGLGVNVALTVAWWSGHEQEIDVSVGIAGPSDEVSCEQGWKVRFNGQDAAAEWNDLTGTCGAGLAAGLGSVGGVPLVNDALRGVYFPVDPDFSARDTFHHYRGLDFSPVAKSWSNWLASVGAARPWFDVDDHLTNDTRTRPLVLQLVRLADTQVVDAARVLMTLQQDANGNPSLVAMAPDTESPGAIAQLSSRGLDRLEPTHAATLPYPIVPAGTQPRLSQSAIADPRHTSPDVDVDVDDLSATDLAYWTQPNPASGPSAKQFAGYLAYRDILAAARVRFVEYKLALNSCPNALCKTIVNASHCVQHEPSESDFRIEIAGVHTFFDRGRPDDALVIGDVTHLDLSFGTNQVLSSFGLEDIQGWLEASIAPADVKIGWISGPPTCVIKPDARVLADFSSGAADYAHWLACNDLSFAAGSGSLGDPIAFDVVANGEQFDTPFAPGTPAVHLASVTTDPGTGICAQTWMAPTITSELVGWQSDVEFTIGKELVTSPGEDEAMNRLLSPYELGVPRIDAPPPGTPPYDVHPLAIYDLSARIAKTHADAHGAQASATDGLYLPYLTQSAPPSWTSAFATWFCPVLAGQFCNGLAGSHEPLLEGGRAPDNSLYDVAINYTTAHLSQALWAQARRPDRLGAPLSPAMLAISETAVADRAAALGYSDVTQALAAVGTRFAVRYHQEAAPYTIIPDATPPRLIYATQNVVVELVAYASDGKEVVVARFLVDVIDFNHHLAFQTGGVPAIAATWGAPVISTLTTTYLAGCYDAASVPQSCNQHLQTVVMALWTTPALDAMLDMMQELPALQLFDAGQQSGVVRHLRNPRTYLVNEGVVLVGDLCTPGAAGCP